MLTVQDVRTSDDAVLTVKIMLFFELADLEKMLNSTHDPIGGCVWGEEGCNCV